MTNLLHFPGPARPPLRDNAEADPTFSARFAEERAAFAAHHATQAQRELQGGPRTSWRRSGSAPSSPPH
ncbi:hypothetical protein [Kitasatospora sp. NPDC018619]|uniref:hypothetical protein n=1 Tax=unclassified Kitasatospora TaxID=2633591 RepID=UPI0037A9848B